MLLYARVFRDGTVRTTARALLLELPAPQGNSVVRLIERHLVAGSITMRSAFLQQGALQLYRMYCHSGRCRECEIGVELSFVPS
jgi:hypothetical protein